MKPLGVQQDESSVFPVSADPEFNKFSPVCSLEFKMSTEGAAEVTQNRTDAACRRPCSAVNVAAEVVVAFGALLSQPADLFCSESTVCFVPPATAV